MTEHTWRGRLHVALSGLAGQFWGSETAVMATLALVVGVGAGLGAVALVWSISWLTEAFFGTGAHLLATLGRGYVVVLPAVGGLLAAILLHLGARGQHGFDVSDVVAALATRGGSLNPLVALTKAVAAAITIGSGGSAGREGPIVHIGSAIGAAIGRYYRLNARRVTALVAAGAAGGIAATFNAPLAGVMFALEVILGGFALPAFGALVVSAVSAAAVSRALLGATPAFAIPTETFSSVWSLLLYPGLGLLAALVAGVFMRVLALVEDSAAAWLSSVWLRPVLGGLGVGLLGFLLPQVMGMGFQPIEDALRGDIGFTVLATLVVGKLLAATLTLGSGGAGGVIAPALFIGAMLGGAYGQAAHVIFPSLAVAGGGEYALIGMAALLAATMGAPMTAILLLFEMTQDYRLVPALVLATLVSAFAAHVLGYQSIFASQLRRRGLAALPRHDVNLMQAIVAEDAMTPAEALHSIAPSLELNDLAGMFQESGHHGFVVLDEKNELFGIVTLADLERAINTGRATATVGDICTRNVVTIFPDETLDDALRYFASLDVGRIPVVERRSPRHVVGMVRRSDIVRAYSRALVEGPDEAEQTERARLQAAVGAELAEFVLAAGDVAVGRRLREIGLPPDCVVISIHRRGRVVVPRGNTQLFAGDRVIILKVSTTVDALRVILRSGTGTRESA